MARPRFRRAAVAVRLLMLVAGATKDNDARGRAYRAAGEEAKRAVEMFERMDGWVKGKR